MHARPTDLPFGSQSLPMVLRNLRRFLKGLDNRCGIGGLVLPPLLDPKFGAVDANDSVLPNAMILKYPRNPASHFDGRQKLFSRNRIAHGRITNGAWPYRSNQRANRETVTGNHVRDAL